MKIQLDICEHQRFKCTQQISAGRFMKTREARLAYLANDVDYRIVYVRLDPKTTYMRSERPEHKSILKFVSKNRHQVLAPYNVRPLGGSAMARLRFYGAAQVTGRDIQCLVEVLKQAYTICRQTN